MSQIIALTLVSFILFAGEAVSTATKAWVPSVFVSAVLFIIGYWTFFPNDMVTLAGISPAVATMGMYFLITNMGTMLSMKELAEQWRTIVIALCGILGIVAALMTVGVAIFDWQTMVTVTPPLVGGVVSSLIMKEAALSHGYHKLAVLAVSIYVLQGFAGYPLTAYMLKKEAQEVLKRIRQGQWEESLSAPSSESAPAKDTQERPKLFTWLPAPFHSTFFILFRLTIVGLLAYLTSKGLAPYANVNALVLCLVFGVLAKSIGWLESQPLNQANGFGLSLFILMAFIFDGLKDATPSMLTDLIGPIVGTVVIGVSGMALTSWVFGRLLKVSPRLAFSISLTALYGFPANYIITKEVIDSVTQDDKERTLLTDYLMSPMLVGGFVTVTMVSVVLAGIFVSLY